MAKKGSPTKKSLKSLFSKSDVNLCDSVEKDSGAKSLRLFRWKKKKKGGSEEDNATVSRYNESETLEGTLVTDNTEDTAVNDMSIYGTAPRTKKGSLSYSETDLRKKRFWSFSHGWKKKKQQQTKGTSLRVAVPNSQVERQEEEVEQEEEEEKEEVDMYEEECDGSTKRVRFSGSPVTALSVPVSLASSHQHKGFTLEPEEGSEAQEVLDSAELNWTGTQEHDPGSLFSTVFDKQGPVVQDSLDVVNLGLSTDVWCSVIPNSSSDAPGTDTITPVTSETAGADSSIKNAYAAGALSDLSHAVHVSANSVLQKEAPDNEESSHRDTRVTSDNTDVVISKRETSISKADDSFTDSDPSNINTDPYPSNLASMPSKPTSSYDEFSQFPMGSIITDTDAIHSKTVSSVYDRNGTFSNKRSTIHDSTRSHTSSTFSFTDSTPNTYAILTNSLTSVCDAADPFASTDVSNSHIGLTASYTDPYDHKLESNITITEPRPCNTDTRISSIDPYLCNLDPIFCNTVSALCEIDHSPGNAGPSSHDTEPVFTNTDPSSFQLKTFHSFSSLGSSHFDRGHTHTHTDPSYINIGYTPVDTDSSHINIGHTHTETGSSHININHTNTDTDSSHINIGHTHTETGSSHVNIGHTHLDTGSSTINIEDIHTNTGTSHVNIGHTPMDTDPSHVNIGHTHTEIGSSHINTGHTHTDTGSFYVGPTFRIADSIPSSNSQCDAESNTDTTHVNTSSFLSQDNSIFSSKDSFVTITVASHEATHSTYDNTESSLTKNDTLQPLRTIADSAHFAQSAVTNAGSLLSRSDSGFAKADLINSATSCPDSQSLAAPRVGHTLTRDSSNASDASTACILNTVSSELDDTLICVPLTDSDPSFSNAGCTFTADPVSDLMNLDLSLVSSPTLSVLPPRSSDDVLLNADSSVKPLYTDGSCSSITGFTDANMDIYRCQSTGTLDPKMGEKIIRKETEVKMRDVEVKMEDQEMGVWRRSMGRNMKTEGVDIEVKTEDVDTDMNPEDVETNMRVEDQGSKSTVQNQEMEVKLRDQGTETTIRGHGSNTTMVEHGSEFMTANQTQHAVVTVREFWECPHTPVSHSSWDVEEVSVTTIINRPSEMQETCDSIGWESGSTQKCEEEGVELEKESEDVGEEWVEAEKLKEKGMNDFGENEEKEGQKVGFGALWQGVKSGDNGGEELWRHCRPALEPDSPAQQVQVRQECLAATPTWHHKEEGRGEWMSTAAHWQKENLPGDQRTAGWQWHSCAKPVDAEGPKRAGTTSEERAQSITDRPVTTEIVTEKEEGTEYITFSPARVEPEHVERVDTITDTTGREELIADVTEEKTIATKKVEASFGNKVKTNRITVYSVRTRTFSDSAGRTEGVTDSVGRTEGATNIEERSKVLAQNRESARTGHTAGAGKIPEGTNGSTVLPFAEKETECGDTGASPEINEPAGRAGSPKTVSSGYAAGARDPVSSDGLLNAAPFTLSNLHQSSSESPQTEAALQENSDMNSGVGVLSTTLKVKPVQVLNDTQERRHRFHKMSLVNSDDHVDQNKDQNSVNRLSSGFGSSTTHEEPNTGKRGIQWKVHFVEESFEYEPGATEGRFSSSSSSFPLSSYSPQGPSSVHELQETDQSVHIWEGTYSLSNSDQLSEGIEVQPDGRGWAEPPTPEHTRESKQSINTSLDSPPLSDGSLSLTPEDNVYSGVFQATRVELLPSPTLPSAPEPDSPNELHALVDTLKSMDCPPRRRVSRTGSTPAFSSLPPISEDMSSPEPKLVGLDVMDRMPSLPLDLGLNWNSGKAQQSPLEMWKRQQEMEPPGLRGRSLSLPFLDSVDGGTHRSTQMNGQPMPVHSRLDSSIIFSAYTSDRLKENGQASTHHPVFQTASLPENDSVQDRISHPQPLSFSTSSTGSLPGALETSRMSVPPTLPLRDPLHAPLNPPDVRPPIHLASQFSLSDEGSIRSPIEPHQRTLMNPMPEPERRMVPKYRAFPDAYLTKEKEHGKLNPRPGKLIIYDQPGFCGQAIEVRSDIIDGTPWDLPETISIRVVRGGWVLYEKPNFKGEKIPLDEGDIELTYPFGTFEEGQEAKPDSGQDGAHDEKSQPERKFIIGSLRRAVRDYSVPEICLFPEENAEGKKVIFRDTSEDARIFGCPIRANSIIVNAGLWLVFGLPFFEGVPRVLELGGYPNPAAWGVTQPYVCSLHPLKIGEPKVEFPNEPKLVIYEKPYFTGKSCEIYANTRNFMIRVDQHQIVFMQSAGSVKVVGGCWVGYEKEGFRGHQYLLEEGDYQDWRAWGGCDSELRSVRLIRGDLSEPSVVLLEMPEEEEINKEEENTLEAVEAIADVELLGFRTMTQSIHVLSGAWVAYSHVDFSGHQYVLEKGFYSTCLDWGAEDSRICSLQPILQAPGEHVGFKHEVLFYSEPNFQGTCQQCNQDIESLPKTVGIKSCRVLKGSWVFYEGQKFSGRMYVLSEGDYPNLLSMGCPATCSLSSLRTVPLSFTLPSISFFGLECFKGREITLDAEVLNMLAEGFDNFAMSVKVNRGCWVLCEHSNYRGRQILLEPKEISNWLQFSDLSTIGSLYPIRQKRCFFRIKSKERGHFLSVQGNVEEMKSGRVVVTEQVQNFSDLWFYEDGQIKNKLAPSMSLLVMGTVESGSKVVLWAGTRTPVQTWSAKRDGVISSLTFPGLVLDIKGGKTYDRDHAVIWVESEERPSQQWEVELL